MVSQDTLRKFKEKYGSVYFTEFETQTFIWRTLTRAEFKNALALYEDDSDKEEYVCSLCVLWPENFDYAGNNGGYATFLCKEIIYGSSFGPDGRALQQLKLLRDTMEDFDKQAPIIIATAFPQYKLEEIDDWNMETMLERLAQAEWALRNIHGYPFEIDLSNNTQSDPNGLVQGDLSDFPELMQETRTLGRTQQ